MKLIIGAFSFISSLVYLGVALNADVIWPEPSGVSDNFREIMWGFGAGIFFTIAIVEIVAFAKEKKGISHG